MQINILIYRRVVVFLAAMLAASPLLFSTRHAQANPRPLPFTYPYGTLPEDSIEIEQYVDYTPARIEETQDDGSKKRSWDGNYKLQTELEYGLTDHLELGTYLVFKQDAAVEPTMKFDGVKERLRYRFAEEGQLPIDVAVYLEFAQFHDEFEIEEKVILAKRFGNLRFMANLWVEQELERGKDEFEFIYNPTVGATYQVIEKLFLGVEYWARGRFEHEAEQGDLVGKFNEQTHHFLGPAVSLQFGRFWWSVGTYYRLDHTKRAAMVGDEMGKVWVRSVIGLDL
jgi:hypothetical protein